MMESWSMDVWGGSIGHHATAPSLHHALTPLPLAEGGFEILIWLVILSFYGIAQLIQKAKGKEQPGKRPAQERPTPTTAEQELREFLESLAGNDEAEEDRPAPPPAAVPQRAPAPQQPARPAPVAVAHRTVVPPPKPFELELLEAEQRVEREPARHQPAAVPRARQARPADSEFSDVEEFSHPTISSKNFLVGLGGLKMPSMRLSMVTPHSRHAGAIKPRLRRGDDLKRAMVDRTVLGPPVALQSSPEIPLA